jgi:hypothetical protein
MVVGAMVTFLSVAGAYVNIRRRANQSPVESYDHPDDRSEAAASSREQPVVYPGDR